VSVATGLQVVAPVSHGAVSQYIPASSLAVRREGMLLVLSVTTLALHCLAVPVAALVLLQRNALHLLNRHRPDSAVLSVLSAGFRTQLTPAQTSTLTKHILRRRQTHSPRGATTSASPGHTAASDFGILQTGALSPHVTRLAVALMVQQSRLARRRCCGLPALLPSHAFGLLRQMHTFICLAALWMSTATVARVVTMLLAHCAVWGLIAALRPHSHMTLQALDLQSTALVVVQLVSWWMWPHIRELQSLLVMLHALVFASLWGVMAFSAVQRVRTGCMTVRRRLAAQLPALNPNSQEMVEPMELVAACWSRGRASCCQKRGELRPEPHKAPAHGQMGGSLMQGLLSAIDVALTASESIIHSTSGHRQKGQIGLPLAEQVQAALAAVLARLHGGSSPPCCAFTVGGSCRSIVHCYASRVTATPSISALVAQFQAAQAQSKVNGAHMSPQGSEEEKAGVPPLYRTFKSRPALEARHRGTVNPTRHFGLAVGKAGRGAGGRESLTYAGSKSRVRRVAAGGRTKVN
jgi:hypothetical protein